MKINGYYSDKLYIYVKAVDIIGAGANAPETANTLKEENVRYIGVRASLYIENKDDKGVPLTKNREELVDSIKKNNMLYIGANHAECLKKAPKGMLKNAEQGFLTDNQIFVDRKLALKIAKHYKQIIKKHPPYNELMSEDMFDI